MNCNSPNFSLKKIKKGIILFIVLNSFTVYSQSKKPSLSQAEQFVNQTLIYLNNSDSIGFRSLFLKDSLINIEQDLALIFRNKMIATNFEELKNSLASELSSQLKVTNVMMNCYKYKQSKTNKKIYIYHIQASFVYGVNNKKILDFPVTYTNKRLMLLNAISVNEVLEAKE